MRATLLVVCWLLAGTAWARSAGINTSTCFGCHSGGQEPTVALTATPSTFSPGAQVTLTVSIQAINGGNGGMYLRSNGVGTFSLVSGQGTRLINDSEVVHSGSKSAANGFVTFQVLWTAPSAPGGVDLEVHGLSGNANNLSSGDNAGYAKLSLVWGCAGTQYFRDMDLDGFGSAASGTTLNCSTPVGFSELDGDCDDNNELVYPGRAEACNGRDDNCDGQIDEGLATITTYKDDDGDGFGRNDVTQTGCGIGSGWASVGNDCDDTSNTTFPGATEICNLKDDDCDGEIDEGARVICGVGWCRRYGPTCDVSQCSPGTPITESCNGLDDDCDGSTDEGTDICPAAQVCQQAVCVPAPANRGGAGGGEGGGSGATRPAAENDGCDVAGGVFAALGLLSVRLLRRARRSR